MANSDTQLTPTNILNRSYDTTFDVMTTELVRRNTNGTAIEYFSPATEEKQDAFIESIHAEGSAHTSGDKGVFLLGVRDDGYTTFGSNGDYIPLATNYQGALKILAAESDGLKAKLVETEAVLATTADATTIGDTTIVSITNSPRLYYISLSANGANSADVTATVKIGGSSKYTVSLKAGAIWARNIGAGRKHITGSSGDDIIINLSAAQTVHVSVEYADI